MRASNIVTPVRERREKEKEKGKDLDKNGAKAENGDLGPPARARLLRSNLGIICSPGGV